MPELPEVETVRRGLAPVLEGGRIRKLELRRADLRFPFPEGMADAVTGTRVTHLGRRAKYLLVFLSTERVLVIHLGMSGSFRVQGQGETGLIVAENQFIHPRGKSADHDHVVLHMSRGARVIYNDPRRFGFMLLVDQASLDEHPLFAHLGVEPTGNQLSADYMANALKGRATPIKASLMDQRVIAGLGNIYVCEALWRAGISPRRGSGTLVRQSGRATEPLERLVDAVRSVIAEAIAAGGSSLRDHVRADGSLGYFQNAHAVYGREGSACPRSECSGMVQRIVQSNRSSFYCPRCQR